MAMFSTLMGILGGGMPGANSAPQFITITTGSATSGTVTITATTVLNTLLIRNGYTTDVQGGSLLDYGITYSQTNSTTIAWSRVGTNSCVLNLIVIELTPGIIVSQEISSVAFTSPSTSRTDSITAVTLAKTICIPYGVTATSFATVVEVGDCVKWGLNSTIQTQATLSGANSGIITAYANIVQFA